MEQSVMDAFRAFKEAYEKLVKESEEFIAKQKEYQMNLPPTLGKTQQQ